MEVVEVWQARSRREELKVLPVGEVPLC